MCERWITTSRAGRCCKARLPRDAANVTSYPWWQLSGAVLGSLVGGFSGFLANSLQSRSQARSARNSVASALSGEIEALCEQVQQHYLTRLDLEAESDGYGKGRYPYHVFRAERDYMPIFRSLGLGIGSLPSPLPRKLAFWYISFSACLERAHELHDLTQRNEPEWFAYANGLAAEQREAFSTLLRSAADLLGRLTNLR